MYIKILRHGKRKKKKYIEFVNSNLRHVFI